MLVLYCAYLDLSAIKFIAHEAQCFKILLPNAGYGALQVFADGSWCLSFFFFVHTEKHVGKTIVLPVILRLLLHQLQHDLNGSLKKIHDLAAAVHEVISPIPHI